MLSVNGTYDNQPVYIQADIPSIYFIFNITIVRKSNKKHFIAFDLFPKADIIDIDSVISEESIKIYKNGINISNSKLQSWVSRKYQNYIGFLSTHMNGEIEKLWSSAIVYDKQQSIFIFRIFNIFLILIMSLYVPWNFEAVVYILQIKIFINIVYREWIYLLG